MFTTSFILSAAMLVIALVLIWKAAGLAQLVYAHERTTRKNHELSEKSKRVSDRIKLLLAKINYLDEETVYDELSSDEALIHARAITAEVKSIYDACHDVGEVHGEFVPWLDHHTAVMRSTFWGLLEWGERSTVVQLIMDQLESRGVCVEFLIDSYDLSCRTGFAPELTQEAIEAYYQPR